MEDVLHAILERRSIRQYLPTPVSKELRNSIAEAGLYAASGMGRQSTYIIEIADRALRDRLSAINAAVMGQSGIDPFYGAPVVFVVLGDTSSPTYLYDGSLAMGNMMLAAHALGLGSCWVHRAREEFATEEGKALLRSLGLTGTYEGIGHLIVGYPAGASPEAAERRPGRRICVEGE